MGDPSYPICSCIFAPPVPQRMLHCTAPVPHPSKHPNLSAGPMGKYLPSVHGRRANFCF